MKVQLKFTVKTAEIFYQKWRYYLHHNTRKFTLKFTRVEVVEMVEIFSVYLATISCYEQPDLTLKCINNKLILVVYRPDSLLFSGTVNQEFVLFSYLLNIS